MSPYKSKKEQRKYQREWYKKNKERVLKQQSDRRLEKREIVSNYKKLHPCTKCGENRYYVLDFHHLNGDDKEYAVSKLMKGGLRKERLLNEMKKCVILCANCHRELHHNSAIV